MNIRKDYDAAEDLHKRAIAADPNHANNLGNYARLLLGLGKPTGLDMLQRAFNALKNAPEPTVEIECAFYLLANGPIKERATALATVKRLILSGTRSLGWDLSLNIQRATKQKHPDVAWLPKLAAVIADGADPTPLNEWSAWQKASP